MSTLTEIRVPDIGDFTNVEVVEVMVKVGDQVKAEDPLITLETDKAAMEVPAPVAGTIKEMRVAQGDRISEGGVILILEALAADAVAAPSAVAPVAAPAAAPVPAKPAQKPAASVPRPAPVSARPATLPPIDEQTFGQAHASPSVRKFARELGVNLAQVQGSGDKSRVLHEDVKAFVKAIMTGQVALATAAAALPSVPDVDFAKFGEIEERPLTRIQKISGPRLHASWVNIPHVTQQDEADITDLEERRKSLKSVAEAQGVKLTPLAFIIRACVLALREFPVFNTSLSRDGKSIVYKKYLNIGFAADTPNGLLVPVIRDADHKDIFSIARDLMQLSEKAREGKLTVEQMQGGTFTITSLGGIGGTAFTPIVNAPEVAILGASRSRMAPVWDGAKFVPRLILPLSLSYDHRVIDGATGVRFSTYLAKCLTDVDALVKV